jgi:hypothetical protein
VSLNSYNHYFLSSGVLGTNCNTNHGSRLLIISTGSISPDGEAKATVNDTAKKVRKSVSKVFDNTLEVANGVLPESPSMYVLKQKSRTFRTLWYPWKPRKTYKSEPRRSRAHYRSSPARDRFISKRVSVLCRRYVPISLYQLMSVPLQAGAPHH